MSEFRDRMLATFAEQRQALTRFLARRLGNASLAEDLTQETWLRAALVSQPGGIGNPRSYLFRIASNLAHDHMRHPARTTEIGDSADMAAAVPDPGPSPERQAIDRSEFHRFLRAVDQLTPRTREVFLLAKVHELSHAEIAARLGIAKNTVMVHIANALARLDDEYEP